MCIMIMYLVLCTCISTEELEEGSQLLFSDPGDNNDDIDEHLLWVEKYSPKHYTELLSDDVCDSLTLVGWIASGICHYY